jgi:hypothetical protein
VYTINVEEVLTFNETISFSASGNPAGTSVAFVPTSIVAPGSVTMTVSNTGAAAAGDYDITVTGTSTSLTRDTNVGLILATGAPVAPSLTSPANNASNVSVAPLLDWSDVSSADAYEVQISTASNFSSIAYSQIVDESTHVVASPLASDTQHYWRVRGSNGCGEGAWSATRTFTTLVAPEVLLVDDDDNGPDVRPQYTGTLDAMGISYDIWDTNNSDNEPSFAELAPYKMVIWFTGDEFGGAAGPGTAGQNALAAWLDAGGCLFLSSQDFLYDREQNSFTDTYLGVASHTDDTDQAVVTGQGPIFGSIGTKSLSYPFTDYADRISPNASAFLAFSGDNGDAGVMKDGGVYRTIFLGFPIEAFSASDRQDVLQAAFDWCAELNPQDPPCPWDTAGNGGPDGEVGTDDFFALLQNWGSCAGECPWDTTGPNSEPDGEVGVDDFFALLQNWGPCPES